MLILPIGPALAHHLEATIKTGEFCVYTPEPRASVPGSFDFPRSRRFSNRRNAETHNRPPSRNRFPPHGTPVPPQVTPAERNEHS
jgi:hypothetical protein